MAGEAIYPSELDANDEYYGVGALYIPGNHVDDLDEAYLLWAIREGRAVQTHIEARKSRIFVADVAGIGKFGFKLRPLEPLVRYTGNFQLNSKWLIGQLAPFEHDALDNAVIQHDFYFAGFTPKLNTSF